MFLYFALAGIGSLTAKYFLRIKEETLLLSMLLVVSLGFMSLFFVIKVIGLVLIAIMAIASGIRDIYVSKGIHEHS